MKKNILCNLSCFILLLISISVTLAQKPEKVYSITKQWRSFEWYKSAAEGWRKEIDKNSKNAEAWLNYYIANRMAKLMYSEQWQKMQGTYFRELNKIVEEIEKAIPNTFESYYIKYYNSHSMKDEDLKNLFEAYKMDSTRVETYMDMVKYYEVKRDSSGEKKFCQKWFDKNDISPSILNWNYNVLASLGTNGIIITNGDNDTFPVWILQYVKNYRKDIITMNINLMVIEEYREKLFKECDIKTLSIDWAKLKSPDDLYKIILNHIIKNSMKRPVYLALTLQPSFYDDIKDKAYMIGLAFKYSEKDIDNIAMIINNFENNWLLDYLKIEFSNDISSDIVNQINTNYLPVFAKLYEHYKLSGNEKNMKVVNNLAKTIAERSNTLGYFNELFKK